MESSEPAPDLSTRARLATLGTGAAWLLGLAALLQVIAVVIGGSPPAEAAVGALVVDVAAGRAGILWATDAAARPLLVRRVLVASGMAAAVVLVTLVIAGVQGWVRTEPGHIDGLFLLAIGTTVGVSIRDELLLRAVPIHFAKKAGIGNQAAIAFAAALSPTPFLLEGAPAASVVLAVATGFLFASLYVYAGGAWAAIAARCTWSLAVGPFSHGGVADVRWRRGELMEGSNAAGPPAFMAALVAVALALLVLPRLERLLVGPAQPEPAPTPPGEDEEPEAGKDDAEEDEEDEAAEDDADEPSKAADATDAESEERDERKP